MDATTVIVVLIVIGIVVVGIALYLRRRPEPVAPGGQRAKPPGPASGGAGVGGPPVGKPQPARPSEEAPAQPRTRSGGHLFEQPEPAPDDVESARGGAAIPETEAVRFTAFHPKEASVEKWYSLLVYAHVETALSQVQTDAARFKDEMGGTPREVRSATPAQLARGTEITVVPTSEGVIFNPERVTFKWVEDVHRADFRFRAGKELADSAANILITVFVGPLIVATIKGGVLFSAQAAQPTGIPNVQTTASLYKSEEIFPSYSHDDEDIVLACRNAYKALGFDFLRDRDTLRPGEDWNATLKQMIDRADIFQLFWSAHSAKSTYCQQEWQYALQQSKTKSGAFVRPVYWQQPLVPPPPELANLHFAYVPLAAPKTP
jgi:TIR domain